MASALPLQTQRTFVIILRTTGLLSLLGSSWIVAEILSDRRNKLKLTYHRFLLGMSISDAAASLFWFLSSWCVPVGTWWKAAGNAATCRMQAFFTRFTITTALYNASLSLYYLLVLRLGWKEKRIRKRVEPAMHFVAISVGLGSSISGLAMDAFGPNGPYCHVVKGRLSPAGEWFLKGLAWYIISMAVMTVCMISCYVHIRRTEAASDRHYRRSVQSLPPQSQLTRSTTSRSRSREFARQGTLYVVAFYLTYLFPIAVNIQSAKHVTSSMTVIYLAHVFFPLQGFFNFYVYLRPRYRKYRKDFPEIPPWKVALRVLRRPFKNRQWRCAWCCCSAVASVGSECDDDGDARLAADLALDSTSRSSQQSSTDSGTRGSFRGSIGRFFSWSHWARGQQSSQGQGDIDIVLSSAGGQTRGSISVKDDEDNSDGTDAASCTKRPSASSEHAKDANHKVGAICKDDVEIGGRDLAKGTEDDLRVDDD